MHLPPGLKLRHLEVFVEVARRHSVTRAAEALGLGQPAVSRTLRELEAICDTPLFVKQGRGIRLTAKGALFLDHAGRSLALVQGGMAALAIADAGSGPRIALGALPTVSARLIPDSVAAFRASGLRAQFSVRTGDNDLLLEQLRRGALDLVVGRLPAPENMPGLSFDPLFRERVLAVVHPDHPLAGRSGISDADLALYPVLLPTRGSIIRPFVERLLLEHALTPPTDAIETVSDSFGRRFTQAHGAIWFISQGVVRGELEDGQLVRLPLNTESTLGPVGLCRRRDHQLDPTAQQFCDLLHRLSRKVWLSAADVRADAGAPGFP